MKKYRSILLIVFISIIIFLLTKLPYKIGGLDRDGGIISDISFIDRSGNLIEIDEVTNSIITLSAAHTENLFHIGSSDKIIGTTFSSVYPFGAIGLEKFNLQKEYDVNRIIEIDPDFILVDPMTYKKNKSVISSFEAHGITVVNLMPQSFNEFPSYIKKLGIITNNLSGANNRLNQYSSDLDKLNEITKFNRDRASVFIELSEKGYFTVTNKHLIYSLFQYAGVDVITPKSNFLNSEDDRIKVGFNYIEDNNMNFNFYFTIRGASYSGASDLSIKNNLEYKKIDVINKNNYAVLDSSLVGRYTFRMIDGIKEITRLVYGPKDLDIPMDTVLDRRLFCEILYKVLNLKTYIVSNYSYYETKKNGHLYGAYLDVNFDQDDFNIIETVTMKSYIKPIKNNNGKESFNREQLITTDDMYHLNLMYNGSKLNMLKKDSYVVADLLEVINSDKN